MINGWANKLIRAGGVKVYEKEHKAQKDYRCDHCGAAILKGDTYTFGKGRAPRYDEEKTPMGKQMGIIALKIVHGFQEGTKIKTPAGLSG